MVAAREGADLGSDKLALRGKAARDAALRGHACAAEKSVFAALKHLIAGVRRGCIRQHKRG